MYTFPTAPNSAGNVPQYPGNAARPPQPQTEHSTGGPKVSALTGTARMPLRGSGGQRKSLADAGPHVRGAPMLKPGNSAGGLPGHNPYPFGTLNIPYLSTHNSSASGLQGNPFALPRVHPGNNPFLTGAQIKSQYAQDDESRYFAELKHREEMLAGWNKLPK